MWKDFIKNSVLKPGLQRLGTVGATLLLAGGDWLCKTWEACGLVSQDGAHEVMTYVVAATLLGFDVLMIHLDRMKGRK